MKNRFHYEPLTDEEIKHLREKNSFKSLLIYYSFFAIPIFLIFVLLSFFPFIPNRYGLGAAHPSSLTDYFKIVGERLVKGVALTFFMVFITTLIDVLRTMIDIKAGYKKVSVFQVTSVIANGTVKIFTLNSGKKVKISGLDNLSAEAYFDEVSPKEFMELSKTKTNRILRIKLMKDAHASH